MQSQRGALVGPYISTLLAVVAAEHGRGSKQDVDSLAMGVAMLCNVVISCFYQLGLLLFVVLQAAVKQSISVLPYQCHVGLQSHTTYSASTGPGLLYLGI